MSEALDCPAGWYGFEDSCYLLSSSALAVRGLSWYEARSKCIIYGGDLVSVANKEEMDFINIKSSRDTHYWIGLNDLRAEDIFVWSDGTPYNRSVYSNWYPREPNDVNDDEDCVELVNTTWNDDNCKKEHNYICKRPKGTTTNIRYISFTSVGSSSHNFGLFFQRVN